MINAIVPHGLQFDSHLDSASTAISVATSSTTTAPGALLQKFVLLKKNIFSLNIMRFLIQEHLSKFLLFMNVIQQMRKMKNGCSFLAFGSVSTTSIQIPSVYPNVIDLSESEIVDCSLEDNLFSKDSSMCGMPIQPVFSFSSDDLAPSSFSVLPFIITILYMLGFSSSSSSLIFTDITDQRVIQMPSGEFFFLIELTLKKSISRSFFIVELLCLFRSILRNSPACSTSLYRLLNIDFFVFLPPTCSVCHC